MRFSIWPINQQPVAAIVATARHADRTGWDGVWMADHLLPSAPPLDQTVAECWTTLVAIASQVEHVRLGTLVLSNTFRHPAVLAKMLASLGELAPGRVVAGLGAGWQRNEHDLLGIELPPPGERLRRLDDTCRRLRAMLDEGRVVGGSGTPPDAEPLHLGPVPNPRIPLLLGLKGDRALALVARHADEWNLWASPERLGERTGHLVAHCDAVGRDPSTIRRVVQAVVAFDEPGAPLDERWTRAGLPLLTGGVEAMRDQLGAYREAGLDEFVVPDFALGTGARRHETMDRFLVEVAGEFR